MLFIMKEFGLLLIMEVFIFMIPKQIVSKALSPLLIPRTFLSSKQSEITFGVFQETKSTSMTSTTDLLLKPSL